MKIYTQKHAIGIKGESFGTVFMHLQATQGTKSNRNHHAKMSIPVWLLTVSQLDDQSLLSIIDIGHPNDQILELLINRFMPNTF